MFYFPPKNASLISKAYWVVRQVIFLAIVMVVLYLTANKLAFGGTGGLPAAPLPSYLLKPEIQDKMIAQSKPGTPQRYAMNAPGRPSYKDNPKWIAYQKRRDTRKKYALQKRAAYNNSKNWSRTPLNYRLNIDITNPMGINPWSNYPGNYRFNPVPRRVIIAPSRGPVIQSPGDLIR